MSTKNIHQMEGEFKNPSTIGTWGEMVVCANLLALGYEPFRAISPFSPCDLLVLGPNKKVLRIEVRKVTEYATTTGERFRVYTDRNNEWYDHLALCFGSGEVIYEPPLDGSESQVVRHGQTAYARKEG